jgi:hypothetical protein
MIEIYPINGRMFQILQGFLDLSFFPGFFILFLACLARINMKVSNSKVSYNLITIMCIQVE